ncbi:progonadoliberin-2 [Equus asinus]|uniref:Progonadoliberin-2 n=1 Tax=Equus przewalskii TaxID=9798 RepID=A0ABM4LUF9_EQUPR|nr:progonadoliberin-2 [Equus caballus]
MAEERRALGDTKAAPEVPVVQGDPQGRGRAYAWECQTPSVLSTIHGSSAAMASFGLGLLLLLLLLLTTHPGTLEAQHWSHGWYPGGKRASSSPQNTQHALRPPGRILGTAASSPGQIAHSHPSDALVPHEDSVPWESRTMAPWPLHGKQHLVQRLLVSRVTGPQHWPPVAIKTKNWGL